MNVKEISIADLKPYENNPRKNDSAVDAVAKSIEQFGFKVPIVIDSENVIVCGHTRLKAAQMLGLEKIPCVIADDLTPEQAKAFRLVDNKTAEFATWDFEKLDEELAALTEINFDVSDFGFDLSVVDNAYVNMDELFEKHETPHNDKKSKTVTCPHCGESFEL